LRLWLTMISPLLHSLDLLHRLILRVQHSVLMSLIEVHFRKIVVHEVVEHENMLLGGMR